MITVVDLKINNNPLVNIPFFNGNGYSINGISYPTSNDWLNALSSINLELQVYGLSFIINETDETVIVYNNNCTPIEENNVFDLNVGINFNIFCND